MRTTILASVGSVLLSVLSPAFAADLPPYPVKGAPPPPYIEPYYNWTGFYVGINAGYGFGTSEWVGLGSFDVDGFIVGGTLGYNFQSGAWVWGLEADIAWSDIEGNRGPFKTENQWLGTVRGRIGYAFDRWLPYITGGGAFGDIKATSPLGSSSSSVQFGWTVGAGMEVAFAGAWTAKIEYLYVDLGSGSCDGACSPAPFDVDLQTSLVRGGINYRF